MIRDVVERRELGDDLTRSDESSAMWSSDESWVMILTRSDESSPRSPQCGRRRGRATRA
jgi:hypothetical protein